MAIIKDDYESVVKFLTPSFFSLTKSVNVNEADKHGNTPLILALLNGNLKIAEFLIDKGADVNTINHTGDTLLIWASNNGYRDIARLMIDKGADVNKKNDH